jgi:hypothetical protein
MLAESPVEPTDDAPEPEKPSKREAIFRVACKSKPYTMIGNGMLRDDRLSIESRGSLAMIVSYPPDWTFNLQWFCKKAGIGRNKAWRILRELEEAGYCQRERTRDERGRLGPVAYVFSDEALPAQGSAPHTQNQCVEDSPPHTHFPCMEKRTLQRNKEVQKNEIRSDSLKNELVDATRRSAARTISKDALDYVRVIAPR